VAEKFLNAAYVHAPLRESASTLMPEVVPPQVSIDFLGPVRNARNPERCLPSRYTGAPLRRCQMILPERDIGEEQHQCIIEQSQELVERTPCVAAFSPSADARLVTNWRLRRRNRPASVRGARYGHDGSSTVCTGLVAAFASLDVLMTSSRHPLADRGEKLRGIQASPSHQRRTRNGRLGR